jgi:DHA2 family multidrug resistance protein
MVLFRLLQGMTAATVTPLSQAVLLNINPKERHARAMALFTMAVVVAPAVGPVVGGWLTEEFSWRWCFYINLPAGLGALALLWVFLPAEPAERRPFDFLGFGSLAIALTAFQLMLDRGTTKDWFSSSEVIVEAVVAGLGFYLFLVHMFTTSRSFVPLDIFKDRNFSMALVLMLIVSLIMLASSALLPPYLENLGGYTVTETGMLMAPRGIGTMIAMVFAGRLAMRLDSRHVMAAGTAMLLWTLWEMSRWMPSISPAWLGFVSFVQGVGMGLIFVPMNLIAFATLSPTLRTDASAMFNLIRNVGSAIGVSITTTVLASSIQTIHAQLAGNVSPFNRALGANAPSMLWNPQLPFGVAQLDAIVQYNAQIIAYANDFLFMFFISLPALAMLFLMKRPALLPSAPPLEVME